MTKFCKYCGNTFELVAANWPCRGGKPTGGRCLNCHRADSARRRLDEDERARQRAHSRTTKRAKYASNEAYRAAEKQKALLFARNNRGYINARNMLRRQLVRARAPKWLSIQAKVDMAKIYQEAARLSKVTGVPHHVDHVVPLQGRTVSGLHVPWNLQVIPAKQNLSKHNSFGE